ncbi:hypothetical protein [Streptomyces sp. NPDC021212]|uniref:hypothetical protein n=1 Tax=Streptomyces sp. NPDC021212 TaxID=3365118 RepID=UPI00378F731B
MSVAAVPANASTPSASAETRQTASCNEWIRAVGVPGRWQTLSDDCGHFGRPGLKMGYSWAAERGRPCIKVQGFVGGRAKWYNAGCGATGRITVKWGDVLAAKKIKVKGASLFKWK